MSDHPPDASTNAVFQALADPTRRAVLGELAHRTSGTTASELARPLPVSRQAVVKHLQVLSDAGLVEAERAGREVRFQVCPEPLHDAVAWIADVGGRWDRRLERLKTQLERRR